MGQENEEQAELIATIQHDHVQMKQWYNNSPEAQSTLHSKYGSTYPSFWRDVITWNGWKESRKLFLKALESKDGQRNGVATENSVNGTSSAIADANENNTGKRKRRSRWGTTSDVDKNNNGDNNTSIKRKSRWGDRGRDGTSQPNATNAAINTNSVLDILPGLPTNLSGEQNQKLKELQALLREANQKLENLEIEASRVDALPKGHPDRSPSPPPIYGADGIRKNTRVVRWRERYTTQRQDTLEQILSLTTSNPNATSSIAPSLFNRKRTRKIHIPVEQHPTYNFIGLIIGPRGKTQKDMETKTNCKIAIRGKGSVKEGARGRRDGKMIEGDDEPLHVLITGDNQKNVDAAADMIEQMLVVIDDDKNIHKQQQLRELALLNGTLKEDEYCPICAEKGHRAFECPKRFSMNNKNSSVQVKCAICGDTSHPTRDCRQNVTTGGVTASDTMNNNQNEKELDSDYLAFMNELDGKPSGGENSTSVVPSAAEAEAAAAANRKQLESLVTTIEKSVGGETIYCAPASSAKIDNAISSTQAPTSTDANASTGGALITTISSRIVKSAPEPPIGTSVNYVGTNVGSITNAPGVSTIHESITAAAAAAPQTSIETTNGIIPNNAMSTTMTAPLPPPPPAIPTSAPPTTYYGQQQQQQGVGLGSVYHPPPQQQYGQQQNHQYSNNNHNNYYGSYQGSSAGHLDNHQAYYGQQQYYNQQYQPQQQPKQQQGGWKYNKKHGLGNTNDDTQADGGFNWWDAAES